MKRLIQKIEQSTVSKIIDKRLKEFKKLNKKGNDEWFSELCFCILTANSKASTAFNIQKVIGSKGFLSKSRSDISRCIKRNKHRFHNVKAEYIIAARKHHKIRDILKNKKNPREWLIKNIKGLGWKESSHFLRNVGYDNYAILDRHIINSLYELGKIKKKPKGLTKEKYLEIERIFNDISKKLNMAPAKLDLCLWYLKTGKVLK